MHEQNSSDCIHNVDLGRVLVPPVVLSSGPTLFERSQLVVLTGDPLLERDPSENRNLVRTELGHGSPLVVVDGAGGELQNRRRLFRWKSAAAACAMTILLLGSGLMIGWNFYQGRGRDILEAQRTLAVTTDHLEFKMDTVRQHARKYTGG